MDLVFEAILLVVGILLLILGASVVRKGTKRKSKFGINAVTLDCPTCNELAPKVRKPENVHQTLWGGFTCKKCGAEVDKWGRLR